MMQEKRKLWKVVDRRLELTNTRLHNMRENQSSMRLTIRAIVNDIVARKEIRFPIEKLPRAVQHQCLEYFLAMKCPVEAKPTSPIEAKKPLPKISVFIERRKIFGSLLRTTKPANNEPIDLNGLMTFCPYVHKMAQLLKVIKLIVAYVPKLETLIISENFHHHEIPMNYVEQPNESRKILMTIRSLTKLKKLTISSFNVNFSDLKALCRNLKDLQYLKVMLDFGREKPQDLGDATAFANLKFFFFSPITNSYDKNLFKRLTYTCLDQLPNLQIVRARVGSNSVDPDEVIQFRNDPQLNNRIYRLDHLIIKPESCPFHLMFPHLTQLEIMWPRNATITKEDVDSTLKFTQLESLSLKNVPSAEILDRFLQKYGSKLTQLRLSNTLDCHVLNYEFKKISESCSELEVLHLDGIVDTGSSVPSMFSKLKYLFWASQQRVTDSFANMMHAPDLEEIHLEQEFFHLRDIKTVASLIKTEKILSKLKRIVVVTSKYPNQHPVFYSRMRELVLNASAFLPNLIDVDFVVFGNVPRGTVLSNYKLDDLLLIYHGRV